MKGLTENETLLKKPGETLAEVSNFKQAIQNWRQIIIYILIVSTSDLWYACANSHIQIYFPSGFSKLSIVWHNINLNNHYLFIHQSNLFCILRHYAAFPANCVFHHERRIPVCSISCILKALTRQVHRATWLNLTARLKEFPSKFVILFFMSHLQQVLFRLFNTNNV